MFFVLNFLNQLSSSYMQYIFSRSFSFPFLFSVLLFVPFCVIGFLKLCFRFVTDIFFSFTTFFLYIFRFTFQVFVLFISTSMFSLYSPPDAPPPNSYLFQFISHSPIISNSASHLPLIPVKYRLQIGDENQSLLQIWHQEENN